MMKHAIKHNRRPHPRAFTLVELLVAIAIISLLAGIALPRVKDAIEGQKLNRAASLLQAAIEEGRGRAISGGGGGGIIIDRVGTDNVSDRSESIQIRFATVSPPYNGDIPGATVKIGLFNFATPSVSDDRLVLWFDPTSVQARRAVQDRNQDPSRRTLINFGDFVQLDDGGLNARVINMNLGNRNAAGVLVGNTIRNSSGLTAIDIPDAQLGNWVWMEVAREEEQQDLTRFLGQDDSFVITRTARPAIALPIEMPRGTAIDLTASGVGRYGNQFSPMAIDQNYLTETANPFIDGVRDYQSIYVLFGARGEVSRVLGGVVDGAGNVILSEIPTTGDLFFLVGERGSVKTLPGEQLEDQDTDPLGDGSRDGTTPMLNPESIWITIKANTGEVIASPWIDPTNEATGLIGAAATTPTDLLRQARIRRVLGLVRSGAIETREAAQ
jgi:prepilin-type N-terminal cleavage/methylation domain-containing protein